MKVKVNKSRDWHIAFNEVMDRYEDARALSLNISSEGFYRSLSNEGGAGAIPSKKVVRPTLSDFIADVEIAAKRVLTGAEYEFFKTVCLDQEMIPDTIRKTEAYRAAAISVSAKVGKAFVARSIYPLTCYFRPKDTRT